MNERKLRSRLVCSQILLCILVGRDADEGGPIHIVGNLRASAGLRIAEKRIGVIGHVVEAGRRRKSAVSNRTRRSMIKSFGACSRILVCDQKHSSVVARLKQQL